MKISWKTLLFWTAVLAGMIGLFMFQSQRLPGEAFEQIAYSELVARVDRNEVRSVTISGSSLRGESSDGTAFRTALPEDPSLIGRLLEHGVRVEAIPDSGSSILVVLLTGLLPIILLGALWVFAMREPRTGGGLRGMGMGFGKSPARLQQPDRKRVTLADVAGIDEAEEELKEIVEFLKDPAKFQRLGGKMPKGSLLVGPPGTGKTLLARAIAGEANVPFYTISGSDFVEMFVGVGAARVRDMFMEAKTHAPCIVFIDELDAVGRRRGAGVYGANDEREQTLNQLLVEMDGFDTSEGVILLAATNRPDILDPALLRPGRFDRQIVLSNPDILGRQQILAVHLRKVPVAPDVDVKIIARGTPGFSGADLANLVNEAALLAARRGNTLVTMAEFEQAKDKVLMGAERRSMAMTEREKLVTAYHEAGHALVTLFTPGSDPLHKVTIIPRGRTLGTTVALPERDRHGFTKAELQAKIGAMLGGRVAEELVFGKENITTGAADDLRQVTELARRMVTEFGFSEKVGPLNLAEAAQPGAFGAIPYPRGLSEATAALIDRECRRFVEEGEVRARRILDEHFNALRAIAEALVEYETLTGPEIQALASPVAVPVQPSPAGSPAGVVSN